MFHVTDSFVLGGPLLAGHERAWLSYFSIYLGADLTASDDFIPSTACWCGRLSCRGRVRRWFAGTIAVAPFIFTAKRFKQVWATARTVRRPLSADDRVAQDNAAIFGLNFRWVNPYRLGFLASRQTECDGQGNDQYSHDVSFSPTYLLLEENMSFRTGVRRRFGGSQVVPLQFTIS